MLQQFNGFNDWPHGYTLRTYQSVMILVSQSESELQSVSDRLHERVSSHSSKLCTLASDHSLHRCISGSFSQGSPYTKPLRETFNVYKNQLESNAGQLNSEIPSRVIPPWQSVQDSLEPLRPGETAQLRRSLRFRYLSLHNAAA